MKRLTTITTILLLFAYASYAQQKSYGAYSLAFYNVENLFDTIDDPDNSGDDEYLPDGSYKWTNDKYEKKLDNIAKVISRLAREHTPMGPAVIGVAEVENRKVLEDLVKRPAIADMNLMVIHQESPDRRGIDVALLYNPALFEVENYKIHPYNAEESDYTTRDHLLVSGLLDGERVHVIVNHWPSRFGGARSSALREHAARNILAIADSIYSVEKDAKIVMMGDLNDDPNDKSLKDVLKAKKRQQDVRPNGWYNPMWNLFDKGVGSLAYQGKWNLFDQIVISHSLLGKDYSTLKYWKAEVFNKDFLIQKEGKDKGYPHRTFSGNTFIDGYSDHFPTLIYLLREVK